MQGNERYCSELIERLDQSLDGVERTVLAIDGRCAAGKSTLADLLCAHYGAQVIRMDHFFLPLEMQTQQRHLNAGSNVHYERFLEQVAPFLRTQSEFEYDVFSCKSQSYSHRQKIRPTKLFIVEGVYSLRPDLFALYDIRVFMDVSKGEQQKRILKRNGEAMLKDFIEKWIPLEEKYFSEYSIAKKCDFVLLNE